MKVVMIRVGIDGGAGRFHGPLFSDGSFEFVPIPEDAERDLGKLTYQTARGPMTGKPLSQFVPPRLHTRKIHDDPEWRSFTYGDPNQLKRRFRHLEPGDLLAFYCGLHQWPRPAKTAKTTEREAPALYLIGYFEVEVAGLRSDLGERVVKKYFSENFHVNHRNTIDDPTELILVKGNTNSRLLKRAVCISQPATDRNGKATKVLSEKMRRHFGDLNGKTNITRSGPRWITDTHVEKAANFLRSLE